MMNPRLNDFHASINSIRLRVGVIPLILSLIKSEAIPSGAKITNRLDKMDSPDFEDRAIPKRLQSSYEQLEIIGGIQLYHHLIMPIHEPGDFLVTHQQDWVTQSYCECQRSMIWVFILS